VNPATAAAIAKTKNEFFLLLEKKDRNSRYIVGNQSSVINAYRNGDLPMSRTFIGGGPKGENLVFETDADGAMFTRLVERYNKTYGAKLAPSGAVDGPPPAAALAPAPVTPPPSPAPAPVPATTPGTSAPTPVPVPVTPPPATPAPTSLKTPAAAAAPLTGLAAIKATIAQRTVDPSQKDWRVKLRKFPAVTFEAGSDYFWTLETNKGTVRMKFMPEVAPNHVANFLYLTQLGYFDGLSFHRVVPGFVAQGGCPYGAGYGGPGYAFDGEFSPTVKHDRPGLLSMANRGPGTDGSQFFITYTASPNLDGKHTIFGEVVAGMDVVKSIEAAGSPSGQTTEAITITKATVQSVASSK